MSVPERLASLAEAAPEREALRIIRAGEDDIVLTRAQVLRAAHAAAQQLPAEPGELVIIVQRDLLTLVSTFFGAMLKGAVPSILPFATEKLHPERYAGSMAALLRIAAPAVLAVENDVRADVEGLLPTEWENLPQVVSIEQSSLTGPLPEVQPRPLTATALLQHSSGTTGLQKGVMLNHDIIFKQVDAYGQVLGFRDEDVVCSWLPLYHDMGLIAGFLMPLLTGARLVLMSAFDWVRNPALLLEAISTHGGTFTWLPNFAYNFLAGKVRERHLPEGFDLSSMRAFVNCSEPVYASSHRQFAERYTAYGVTPEMLTVSYAMAEAVFAVTQTPLGHLAHVDVVDRVALQAGRAVSTEAGPHTEEMVASGVPLPGIEVAVWGDDHHPLPERHVGQIVLRGPTMFDGYYQRADATQAAFHEGWYLTGDLGYIAEGQLYVQGRQKDLIIVGGKNVYPNDLERLANEVEGVYPGRVAAFGVPNEKSGTEDVVIVAETEIDEADARKKIASSVRRAIAAGSDVAVRDVRLVERGWLIKTSSGKMARSDIRKKYLTAE